MERRISWIRLEFDYLNPQQAGVIGLVPVPGAYDPLGVLASEEELDRLTEARVDDAIEVRLRSC